MLKIAVSGKAKSGKDTFSNLLMSSLINNIGESFNGARSFSFADPIKKIIKIMFPKTKNKYLYGPSEYRETVIPGAFFNGQPLTYRILLQNLGTEVAQGYKKDIWLDALDTKLKKAEKKDISLFVITDLRFLHEYNYLRNNNFVIIRVLRKNINTMVHKSETEQDILKNTDFDYVIDNNGSIEDLKIKIQNLSINLLK